MSCNCGCHDDAPPAPATGWRRIVPLVVGAVVVGALIAGTALKKGDPVSSRSPVQRATTAANP